MRPQNSSENFPMVSTGCVHRFPHSFSDVCSEERLCFTVQYPSFRRAPAAAEASGGQRQWAVGEPPGVRPPPLQRFTPPAPTPHRPNVQRGCVERAGWCTHDRSPRRPHRAPAAAAARGLERVLWLCAMRSLNVGISSARTLLPNCPAVGPQSASRAPPPAAPLALCQPRSSPSSFSP